MRLNARFLQRRTQPLTILSMEGIIDLERGGRWHNCKRGQSWCYMFRDHNVRAGQPGELFNRLQQHVQWYLLVTRAPGSILGGTVCVCPPTRVLGTVDAAIFVLRMQTSMPAHR